MPEYKLTYFDGMGMAEPIRLLFRYMNQPFTDIRMKMEQWPEKKKEMPWGKVPVLEVDGKKVCQSTAICRYLGDMAGLSGKDSWENLLIDMSVDCIHDLRTELTSMFREKDEKKKEELMKKAFEETIPFYFAKYEQQIKDNKGYLVNGKLTWADLLVCSIIQMFNLRAKRDLTEQFPNLHGLMEKFVNHPKLKEYIANRPKTEF